MKVRVLASGSKGNCILVSSQGSALLVDAGLSLKRLREILFDIDFPIKDIQAIVISHLGGIFRIRRSTHDRYTPCKTVKIF